MRLFVAIALILMQRNAVYAPPPLRLTIDCGSRDSKDKDIYHHHQRPSFLKQKSAESSQFDVDTFCNLIQRVIPKTLKDGKFLNDEDQIGYGNNQLLTAIAPPKGFIPKLGPKLKLPRVKVPRFQVPVLRVHHGLSAPRISTSMSFRDPEEESSAERLEKFKKGVQKMLHVVKVLGQIDQYLSERTRIIVDKLTKTFAK